MRLALIFDSWNLAKRAHLDFSRIDTDPRGLTGSELCAVRPGPELVKRGHEVTLFCPAKAMEWEGVRVLPEEELGRHEFDAAISVNHPGPLKDARASVRGCWHLLADLNYALPDLDDYVDLWLSPSAGHREMIAGKEHHFEDEKRRYLGSWFADEKRFRIVPLGCDPERYDARDKRPGRCVYTSSPDRGLHWALQEWPKIRRAAPHAELHIFYRVAPWLGYASQFEGEQGDRARYIRKALYNLRDNGVFLRDSTSHHALCRELSRAECLAYPCDTFRPTETFGVAVLEACAARACPIITDCDVFGGLYGATVPMASLERSDWVSEWRDMVIHALTNQAWREEQNDRAEAFAQTMTWSHAAERLEAVIRERLGTDVVVQRRA